MEKINDYRFLMPLQNVNAGFSRWTFAAKNGTEYFIKEFMNPVYPDEDTLSESLRKAKIKGCENFESKKSELYRKINEISDGNLVRIIEFFRCDSHYYIAMPKIKSEKISFENIAKLPLEDKIILCRTAARSLLALHSARIVHSDIKDTNVLIHRSRTGKFVAKITDFDCGFFEYDPPKTENDLGGDQIYLSPEACLFFCGDETKLTCKMDVFSLGLLFHQYLTGKLPYFNHAEYDYAHEAVLDGNELVVNEAIPERLRNVIKYMLKSDPDQRTDMMSVFNVLGTYLDAGSFTPPSNDFNVKTNTPSGRTPQSFFHQAGNL